MSEATSKGPLRVRALLGSAVAYSAPPEPPPPYPLWLKLVDLVRRLLVVERLYEILECLEKILWMRKIIRRGKRRSATRVPAQKETPQEFLRAIPRWCGSGT